MFLASVNIAQPNQIGRFKTGINKVSQTEPCFVTKLGLQGDHILDEKYHGGEDQAIYCYGGDDYAWWESELGRDLIPGTFGDNCTLGDMSCQAVHIGDRFKFTSVVLEVTAPRIPCAVLGERMGDSKFPLAFRRAERPGFYCRVITEGELRAGEQIQHLPFDGQNKLSLVDLFRLNYETNPSSKTLERVLEYPIASRERIRLNHLLAEMD